MISYEQENNILRNVSDAHFKALKHKTLNAENPALLPQIYAIAATATADGGKSGIISQQYLSAEKLN